MLNELLVVNKDTIALDSTNNVFVGPDEYFQIVIDDFDGTKVNAWHFEDPEGNATRNLARGEGTNIDLLVNRGNRSIGHFIGRLANRIYNENEQAQAQVAELQAQLAEAQQPAAGGAMAAAPEPQAESAQAAELEAALAEKDAALKQADMDLARAEAAAGTAQEKASQLEEQVSELQAQVTATEGKVSVWVPAGIALIAVLALAGMYAGLRRRPAA